MNIHSPVFYIFWAFGFVLGYMSTAIAGVSLVALVWRRRRRSLVVAISALSWIAAVAGSVVLAAHLWEAAFSFFLANPFEREVFFRARTNLASSYLWLSGIQIGGILAPQLFWFRRCRTSAVWALVVCALILGASNLERLIIYFTELSAPSVSLP